MTPRRTTTTTSPSRTTLLLLILVGGMIGFVLLIAVTGTPLPARSYYRECTPGTYTVGRQVYFWECR